MSQPIELTPSRLNYRGSQDPEVIKNILSIAPVCTLSYTSNGQAFALPTGFVLHKDRFVIHGSVKSHFLEQMIGQTVCISAFILDGLVLAASAFHHSMNYRSVVIYSQPTEIFDEEDKLSCLHAFTEKIIPGRWDQLRPVTPGELKATRVLGFNLKMASAKQRTGGPSEEKEDENYPVWTGTIPVSTLYEPPIAAPGKEEWDLPEHITALHSPAN
jgi:uncharacterized protein